LNVRNPLEHTSLNMKLVLISVLLGILYDVFRIGTYVLDTSHLTTCKPFLSHYLCLCYKRLSSSMVVWIVLFCNWLLYNATNKFDFQSATKHTFSWEPPASDQLHYSPLNIHFLVKTKKSFCYDQTIRQILTSPKAISHTNGQSITCRWKWLVTFMPVLLQSNYFSTSSISIASLFYIQFSHQIRIPFAGGGHKNQVQVQRTP